MTGSILKTLLTIAWLLPLLGFTIEVFGGYWGTRKSKTAAYLAVFCIAMGFVCSTSAFFVWKSATNSVAFADDGHGSHGEGHGHEGDEEHGHDHRADDKAGHEAAVSTQQFQHVMMRSAEDSAGESEDEVQSVFSGTFYTLGTFGGLTVSLDYYIDSLTLIMFVMVTFIATCIHVFAIGYMGDELTEDYEDHFVHTSKGGHFHRPGRFYRFFSFLSLFCFAMLGLVLAGNIFQVFIFWELVGICSFFLIGFYTERKSATNAANKAFIMNRVGDFGFLIGLMVIWTSFGTFAFADAEVEDGKTNPGLFSMASRTEDGSWDVEEVTAGGSTANVVYLQDGEGHRLVDEEGQARTIPYYLLVVAGLGVFAGCIGKSAQFPLQTWLPDAMEGPTPVSALVHSATMVAAGVYLTGRFYPMFAPEVLLTIAYIGCITLFLAATIAMVVTDLKQVLAYSTISQLGYMMLGLGVFGWAAGLFHLITHAFFKSLMFLASGSVIHGCHHEQEMPKMGGLIKKMPITAIAMLVGVIAISGLAIPGLIAFSGYHSKDAIVATALAFTKANPGHYLLFIMPLITAGITSFYMFRLWFYTFIGKPRDQHVHDHCHESPWVMTGPLIALSVLAAFCAVWGESGPLYKMLTHSEPAHVAAGVATPAVASALTLPGHDAIHAVHGTAGIAALVAAVVGMLLAWVFYGGALVDPGEIKKQMSGVHSFLSNKWHFDELYDTMFMKPMHIVGTWCVAFDKKYLDGTLHGLARGTINVSKWDRAFDEKFVDGMVNLVGSATSKVGSSFRVLQTGRLRQYVMFIAVGVLALFVLLLAIFPK
jgi:NADH-quinone oxidoreductase subunit L